MAVRPVSFFCVVSAIWILSTPVPTAAQTNQALASNEVTEAIAARNPVTLLKGIRPAPQEPTRRVFFTSNSQDEDELKLVRRRLASVGAWRLNAFYPELIVCELPVSVDPWSVLEGTGVVARSQQDVARGNRSLVDRIARTYDAIDAQAAARESGIPHTHFHGGEATPPAGAAGYDESCAAPDPGDVYIPTLAGEDDRLYYQNSEFLAGNILVRVVFPESKGQDSRENWTTEAQNRAVAAMRQATDYFERHFTNVSLNYDYNLTRLAETQYEPIDMSLLVTDYTLWIDDVMTRLGDGGTDGIVAKIHRFNQALRPYYTDSDWVFTVFVVNGENDPDHMFNDNKRFVYAMLGGPFMILPYSTMTEWLFQNLFIYALGVVFWAPGEDHASPYDCDTYSGYLNVKHGNYNDIQDPVSKMWKNCQFDYAWPCMATVEWMMMGYTDEPCEYTCGHLGYRDEAPRNNVLDVFDSPPAVIYETAARETLFAVDQPVRFTVVTRAVPNRNPIQLSLGPRRDYTTPIKTVSYSLNNVGAILMNSLDGDFDDPVEEFEVRLSFLLPGESQLAVTATNAYAAKSAPVVKSLYYFGLDFWSFRIEHKNEGIGVAWYMRGQTFDAELKLIRRETHAEPAVVDTVAWPDDLQPVSAPQGGLTPFYFLDTDVVPGTEYTYIVEGTFDVDYRGETIAIKSSSQEVRATAAIPRDGMLSSPVPNPFYSATAGRDLLVSVSIPGAQSVPLFSSINGPGRSSGQMGESEIQAIGLKVSVYDVAGRRIKDLFNEGVFTEVVNVTWDGRNRNGDLVPTGVYFIKATVGDVSDSKKVLVFRY